MTHSLATYPIYDVVVCADGATVSVQANRTFWCEPRNDVGPYAAIEAGLPSEPVPDSWAPFREPGPTLIYTKLPVALVWEYLDLHGGMVGGDLPPGCERAALEATK